MRTAGLAIFVICLSLGFGARAQDVAPDYSADEFVRAILSGPQPCPKTMTREACEANPKTRRFKLATPGSTSAPEPRRGASVATAPPRPQARPEPKPKTPILMKLFSRPKKVTSSDVLVTFAVGSAEITPQGQVNLQSIAAGLNKPALASLDFEVAGFTDISGDDAFNRRLSRRRAEAVKAYLVSLDVSPGRLTAVGYGSEHLANPEDPTSEINRRVELHRLN
jgi:outer membrane protein OmpA-like peptidoglycan-associated protein